MLELRWESRVWSEDREQIMVGFERSWRDEWNGIKIGCWKKGKDLVLMNWFLDFYGLIKINEKLFLLLKIKVWCKSILCSLNLFAVSPVVVIIHAIVLNVSLDYWPSHMMLPYCKRALSVFSDVILACVSKSMINMEIV